MPSAANCGLPRCSAQIAGVDAHQEHAVAIAANSAHPWRRSPAILPNVWVSAAPIAKIASISSRLVSGVGFSYGCAELALKKPPPLVPSSLMISCEATGPCAIDLLRALHRLDLRVGTEVLRHALPDQHQREDDADRQQHPQCGAGQIDPEVAQRLGAAAHEAANHRDRDRDAGRGGNEVVKGQPRHLGQVAHGRFAGVGLPVGVGGEAGRGVEGQIGRHRPRTSAD